MTHLFVSVRLVAERIAIVNTRHQIVKVILPKLDELGRRALRDRVVDRWEFDIPTVATVTAAIRDDVAGEPQCVFAWLGEEMARATAVDADDLFGRWTRKRVGEIGIRHGHFKCGRPM